MVTSARVVGGQLTFLLLTSTITHGAVLYGRALCCLDESPRGASRSKSHGGAAEASLKDVRRVERARGERRGNGELLSVGLTRLLLSLTLNPLMESLSEDGGRYSPQCGC